MPGDSLHKLDGQLMTTHDFKILSTKICIQLESTAELQEGNQCRNASCGHRLSADSERRHVMYFSLPHRLYSRNTRAYHGSG